jgi:hypothetical protein
MGSTNSGTMVGACLSRRATKAQHDIHLPVSCAPLAGGVTDRDLAKAFYDGHSEQSAEMRNVLSSTDGQAYRNSELKRPCRHLRLASRPPAVRDPAAGERPGYQVSAIRIILCSGAEEIRLHIRQGRYRTSVRF